MLRWTRWVQPITNNKNMEQHKFKLLNTQHAAAHRYQRGQGGDTGSKGVETLPGHRREREEIIQKSVEGQLHSWRATRQQLVVRWQRLLVLRPACVVSASPVVVWAVRLMAPNTASSSCHQHRRSGTAGAQHSSVVWTRSSFWPHLCQQQVSCFLCVCACSWIPIICAAMHECKKAYKASLWMHAEKDL